MITITVDHRERIPVIVETLRCKFDTDVVFASLKLGDYVVPPDTIVERKTADDFCLSLMDGRLFKQAYALANADGAGIFLIEGDLQQRSVKGVTDQAIKGALLTLAQSFRLPLIYTKDAVDTAWHLHHLALQRQRHAVEGGPLHRYRPKRLETQKQYLLRSIPGVGPKLAQVLLAHYGTVANIVNASPKELAQLPGISAKCAQQICTVLHESPGRYIVDQSHVTYYNPSKSCFLDKKYCITFLFEACYHSSTISH